MLLLLVALLPSAVGAYEYTVEELKDADHSIAIKLAIEEDHTDVLEGLLKIFIHDKGESVQEICSSHSNIYHYADYNPLHYAALLDRDVHIKLLVDAGCDPDMEAGGGMTPLVAAAEQGSPRSARTLLETGANPKKTAHEKVVRNNDAQHRGFEGMTPACMAAKTGKVEVLQVLKDFGGAAAASMLERDMNGHDSQGWAPLHYAVNKGHRDAYRFLVFEVGWGDVPKEEVIEAASTQAKADVKKLAGLGPEEFEQQREKWLRKQAKKAGLEL